MSSCEICNNRCSAVFKAPHIDENEIDGSAHWMHDACAKIWLDILKLTGNCLLCSTFCPTIRSNNVPRTWESPLEDSVDAFNDEVWGIFSNVMSFDDSCQLLSPEKEKCGEEFATTGSS